VYNLLRLLLLPLACVYAENFWFFWGIGAAGCRSYLRDVFDVIMKHSKYLEQRWFTNFGVPVKEGEILKVPSDN